MEGENSTTNTILIIVLVILVGLVVWFIAGRGGSPAPTPDSGNNAGLEVNLGTGDSGGNTGGTGGTENY